MAQLSADCLNEIFEYLEDDMITLHSCLLVNRLWCEVSVRISWRDVRNYRDSNFRTLIACLPNESKEILNKNGINNISAPTSKPPMFNYAAFCRILSISRVYYKLEQILKNQTPSTTSTLNLNDNIDILAQEIFKLCMSQIGSLKKLDLWQNPKIPFDLYPGAKDCLKNLSELYFSSDISSELFFQLSQICHNILSLDISLEQVVSKGITDLISVQKNLKYLTISHFTDESLKDIIPSFTKPNNLNKLCLYGIRHYISLSFIAKFTNLQELELSFNYNEDFEDFEKLQFAIFPQLQILRIQSMSSRFELLIKFLENNGKNLKEIYIGDNLGYSDNSLNLAIAKFCPNLRKLSVGFKNSELETLKIIYESCQYLESIKIWCGGEFLSEKEALDTLAKYSHKNIYEIILYHQCNTQSKLSPEELADFFISWTNREPQKSLSFVIVNCDEDSLDTNAENMKIIEKYRKLGVIKRFKVIDFDDDEFNF
ncbi:hypothetical protein C1645_813579 [Glomus cerebriforme]|uniref:F-box domain-containing protein n=1 Tax=Glomus cerebriforme TaxID=658196 RepID=A0A397TS17_9GLOM|nr:hypothetical protein C1645_813579 [Glomus cerebriforme]